MLYQIIIAVGLVSFALNLILNLRSLKRPRHDSQVPEPALLVSVLIPARDEEANIAYCLGSLQQQDYPNFEIIVLDDNSSDNTAKIVGEIAAEDSRIQLIRGENLPEGWAGKPFACYQLARKARGSWLLFVDADTTHAPHMLRSVLALAHELKPSLLSGFPRQLTNSLPQKIVTAVWYFILLSWLPLWWLQHSQKPKPSLAIGQFMLFPRDEYWRIGGHKAVKSRILEDIWMGVETYQHGGQHVAIDLSPVVACNMYRDLGETWKGLGRSIHSVAALSPVALGGLIMAGYIFFLAPFYWLWNELFATTAPSDWRAIIIFQVAIILIMRWLADNRFKQPVLSTILHPIGISFLILTTLYATSRQLVGSSIHWKKRLYGRESGVQ